MANTYLPIGISLKERPCLVVGGGGVALRKIETLLEYDCRITVVAPEPVEKIEYFARSKKVALEKRAYKSPEATGYGLAIAASNDREANKAVAGDAMKAGIPVNTVDDPPLCTFIFPAIVKRDRLSVSISTDGTSPFLAAHLRVIIDDIFPDHWKRISKAAADFRDMVRRRWPKHPKEQGECYDRFIQTDWKEVFKKKKDVDRSLQEMLEG